MNIYELWIDSHQAKVFLGAIRKKSDVIALWMGCVKSFLLEMPADPERRFAKLFIAVGSMSRLFCVLNDGRKIFSVSFPFSVRLEEGRKIFLSKGGVEIDNRLSSEIVSLLNLPNGGVLDATDFEGFIDPVFESMDVDKSLWSLLRELMLAEETYVRYDWDSDRKNGHLHPEHHLDIGYSSSCTFKVGLKEGVNEEFLISLMDTDTECHYVGGCGVI